MSASMLLYVVQIKNNLCKSGVNEWLESGQVTSRVRLI